MDPNAAMRELAGICEETETEIDEISRERAMELIEAIREWMYHGGFAPGPVTASVWAQDEMDEEPDTHEFAIYADTSTWESDADTGRLVAELHLTLDDASRWIETGNLGPYQRGA